jgi:hypothetical protein
MMTELTGYPGSGGQPVTTASALLADRIFLLDSPRFTRQVPHFLAPGRSGLVLSGDGAHTRIGQIWRQAGAPLLINPARYANQVATASEPFALGNEGMLVDVDLDTLLTGQRQCHAAAAITPSRYVQAGDSAAFKALVHGAQAIGRDDVIVAVPVALPWLTQQQYLQQLIAGLQRIPHPKAVMFGRQKNQNNPFDAPSAIPNFRRLLAETTGVGLWHADVPAAFDCLAHGGTFAAVGAGGSLRHLVPPGQKRNSSKPRPHTPAVLLPAMLRYSKGRFIANKYANTPAPNCSCVVCAGATLNRFDSLLGEVRANAHEHNAAVWTSWLPDLFGHPEGAARQLWWRGFCQAAVDAHEQENARLRQKDAFKPPPALKKLASLPLPAELQRHS